MRKLLLLCLAPSMAFALDNSSPERLEGFWSECFSCIKKTKEIVREVHDISGDVIDIAKDFDEIATGGKHAERIDTVKRYIDKTGDIINIADRKSSEKTQESSEKSKKSSEKKKRSKSSKGKKQQV